jgi:outer membrane lipoprotein carrier protein
VGQFRFAAGFLAAALAFAGDSNLEALLKSVESRYNHAKTLQVSFKEDYTAPGRPSRSDAGVLLLRKPGKMRWDYSQPKGKLFVSDGKYLWLYLPEENRVEKTKLKETEDLRAPLAFLLGKLSFDKEFRNIQGKREGPDLRVIAEPKTENLPYERVEFVVTPDNIIREVKVTGFDHSVIDFTFTQERLNPALEARLFEFQMPKGAELVEETQ